VGKKAVLLLKMMRGGTHLMRASTRMRKKGGRLRYRGPSRKYRQPPRGTWSLRAGSRLCR